MKTDKIKIILVFAISISLSACQKENSENIYNNKTTAVFNSEKTYGVLTDQDGNTYKTITIGSQTWMAENLRTTKYRNGEAIPRITDYDAWRKISAGAYCNYRNTNNIDTIATFGRLYNWYTVIDERNLAPQGWHIPTKEEFQVLIDYLGGDTVAGRKMKEIGLSHWITYNDANNESGFTALPAGSRYGFGPYLNIGVWNILWSNSEKDETTAWYFKIAAGKAGIEQVNFFKEYGHSVRCIKD